MAEIAIMLVALGTMMNRFIKRPHLKAPDLGSAAARRKRIRSRVNPSIRRVLAIIIWFRFSAERLKALPSI